jgi:hypothetical protein
MTTYRAWRRLHPVLGVEERNLLNGEAIVDALKVTAPENERGPG